MITKVVYGDYNWSGPAAAHRPSGVVFINNRYWANVPFETRLFILLHEEGHIVCNTDCEFTADDYARTQYIKQGYSLKAAFLALADMLKSGSIEQRQRIKRHFVALMLYDAIECGNPKALAALKNPELWQ